jgi:hypothetical protein
MTSPTNNTPEPWFATLIENCLGTIYVLSLDGCPAADMVGKTAKLWTRLLWDDKRQVWHEQADHKRIRAAFAGIAATVTRWPAPAKFWDHLKPREKPPAGTTLMGPTCGREREADALRCRDRWLRDLGINAAGEPLESQA